MRKNLIDANLILRFLLNDPPKQANSARKLLQKISPYNILTDIVVAEIIWVLTSFYKQSKPWIVERMRSLIHLDSIECNQALLDVTFDLWEGNNISFIDAYLVAKAQLEELTLYTFDKKLAKIPDTSIKEP